MGGSNSDDYLDHYIKLLNKGHGYAGRLNYGQGDLDKRLVEMSEARDWVRAANATFASQLGKVIPNPADPPDCYVEYCGRQISVELVQFVEQSHKKRAALEETPFAGQLFVDTQWTQGRFLASLGRLMDKKSDNYVGRNVNIDVLLVVTGEPWLTFQQVENWLASSQIPQKQNIANAFFMLGYDPQLGAKHNPVFKLYGDLFEVPHPSLTP